MRIAVHPADRWGCGHYRLIWPAQALIDQGHEVSLVMPGEGSGIGGVILDGRLQTIMLDEETDADIYVFQRPSNILHLDLIKRLRARGKTVVVDMDDDLTCIHPRNVAFQALHPKWSPRNNWHIVVEACKLASLVTVSTPPLLERFTKYNNARVLRNCIPARFLELERPENSEVVWGWAGALVSHPDDLPIIGATVAALQDYQFRILGSRDGTGHALALRHDPEGPGAVPFEDYPGHLARFDVGVAPLNNSRFNRAKSWLKPLEYSALGIPWVASDLPEYSELAQRGGGIVVPNKPKAWTAAVRRLLQDDAYRVEMGQAARANAAEFTIEEHAWRWLETWMGAYQLDHGMAVTGA